MTPPDGAVRAWTEVGKAHLGERLEGGEELTESAIVAAIDGLDWREAVDGEQLPAMPAMGISAAIEQLRLPKVSQYAYMGTPTADTMGHPLAPYGFYGIEANYKDGRARIYVLDTGAGLTPLASDFWPKERT